ncbi:MAG: PEP-CTERM sorting domain-containing protein [Deltaproteobacteria bacterium]|nr:PEP-CTERM sorting domain-containing protein [Deltaproteobacteria bacterium]
MQRIRLPFLKKYAIQSVVALAITAACCQAASADPITSVFGSSWTQITAEDNVGANGYVNPGWGGQDFDAEYLYYKLAGNTLSIGLQSGFDLVDGHVLHGRNYYAGDLALSFDGDDSTYEYAFDFGLFTKDYYGHLVDADTSLPDGKDAAGLYAVSTWNQGIYFTVSNPFAMDGGTLVANANGTTAAGADSTLDSYWRTFSFDITSIGNFVALDAHWTMSCGNDAIDGHAAAPIPEPATMLLFGTGIAGLAGLQRRRLSKK